VFRCIFIRVSVVHCLHSVLIHPARRVRCFASSGSSLSCCLSTPNLQRRIKKLEEHLTDPSGLVPHSQQWLEYWDRRIYEYAMDPEGKRPAVLFSVEAVRAVMQYSDNPASLFGSIPEE